MAGQARSLAKRDHHYIPALGYRWLTPLYDIFQRWLMQELEMKMDLVRQARICGAHRVLDLGTGSGTLTLLIHQMYPQARVVGLDGDPQILNIARNKARAAGLEIKWDQGSALMLPYPDDTFDRVVSSLMFHHLTPADKVSALWEAWRVLRPGGEMHILDFGQPHTRAARLVSWITRRMEQTADEIDGLLPDMFRQAGFREVQVMGQHMTIFGTLSLYKGVKPQRARESFPWEDVMEPSLSMN